VLIETAIAVRRDRVLTAVERRAPEIGRAMAAAARDTVAVIGRVAQDDKAFPARLNLMCVQHVLAFARAARTTRRPDEEDLAFVRELGTRRAQDIFPLEAIMQGIRAGHRVLWTAVVDEAGSSTDGQAAAVGLTETLIDYTDAVSLALEASYCETQKFLASRAELARKEFLEDTLSGHLFGRDDAAARAEAAGFVPDAEYVVAAVTLPGQRADILQSALERRISASGRPSFVVVRDDTVIVVIPAPDSARAVDIVRSAASGKVVAGIGGPCRGLRNVPRACEEAVAVLRRARNLGRILTLDDVGVFGYLVACADPIARQISARRCQALLREDGRKAGTLGQTLATYVECGLSVVRAARVLEIHPNTMRQRLAKIDHLTGLETRRGQDVLELYAALEVARGSTENQSRGYRYGDGAGPSNVGSTPDSTGGAQ
jgi:hypothetical protein